MSDTTRESGKSCDVSGAGNEITETSKRARRGKRRIQPRSVLRIYAPALDPTMPPIIFRSKSTY